MSALKGLGFASLAGVALSWTGGAFAQPSVTAAFDADYSLHSIDATGTGPAGPIPGIPSPYAGIDFDPEDDDALLIAGHAFSADGTKHPAIYRIGVRRNATTFHIVQFAGRGTLVAEAPGLPAATAGGIGEGLIARGNGAFLYTSPVDHAIGVLHPGVLAQPQVVDLTTLLPAPITGAPGPLTRVPPGIRGAGAFKLLSDDGLFHTIGVEPDGVGGYGFSSVSNVGPLPNIGPVAGGDTNFGSGIVYVPGGNPQFGTDNVLISTTDFNTGAHSNLNAYRVDDAGDPVVASRRTVVTAMSTTGATIDPVTGDMLFTTFYGFPALFQLRGITTQTTWARFLDPHPSVSETAGTARVEVVRRGALDRPLVVQWATADGTAVAGVNYTAANGTFHWKGGEKGARRIEVPILDDGVATPAKSVRLILSTANGSNLGAAPEVELTITP